MRKALITGVTGQDGAYLTRFLLARGYRVLGACRPESSLWRLEALKVDGFDLIRSPQAALPELIARERPDELYNLGAQTHVGRAFETPAETFRANSDAVVSMLEAIRKHAPETRFFQASTGAMYGQPDKVPQDESTPIRPSTPYGASKAAAHWAVVAYRAAYRIHASCGILFNHESPIRSRDFVTRRIAEDLVAVAQGRIESMAIGNLSGERDWGFAGEYVEAMWKMLQEELPDDYAIATGVASSVRQFIDRTAEAVGIDLEWHGDSGVDRRSGRVVVRPDPSFSRPNEGKAIVGNPAKANRVLGWEAQVALPELVSILVSAYRDEPDRYRDPLVRDAQ